MTDFSAQVTFTATPDQVVAALAKIQDELGSTGTKADEAGEKTKGIGKKTEEGVDLSMASIMKMAVGFSTVGGAVEKAFELVKEGVQHLVESIPEAIEKTAKLVETYRALSITAGMSTKDFGAYTAAVELAGGKSEDLTEIVRGMERGIRQHSSNLVANGVFADEAALKHATLAQYIAAVVEKMDSYGNASDRDALLMDAFGRSGMAFAATLKEINENMDRGLELGEKDALLTEKIIKDQTELKNLKGEVTHAEEVHQAIVSELAMEYDKTLQRTKIHEMEAINSHLEVEKLVEEGAIQLEQKWDQASRNMVNDWEKMTVAAEKYLSQMKAFEDGAKEDSKWAAKSAQEYAKHSGKKLKKGDLGYDADADQKQKDAQKAAEAAAQKEADIEKSIQAEKDKFKQTLEDQETASVLRNLDERSKANDAAFSAIEKHDREEIELAKIAASDQLNAAKTGLAQKKLVLDQDVAFGRISAEEELAIRKDLVREEEALETVALQARLRNENLTLAETKRIEAEIEATHRKSAVNREKLDKDLAVDQKRDVDFYVDTTAGGMSSLATSMVTQHRNMGEQVKAAWADMAGSILKHLLDIEARKLAGAAIDKTVEASTTATTVAAETTKTAAAETTMAAKIYAWYSSLGPWAIPAAAATIATVIAAIKGIEGREKGGGVSAGTPYIVGEAGHELFIPDTNGTIIPHNLTSAAQMGASLQRAQIANRAAVSRYNSLGAEYAKGVVSASRAGKANGGTGSEVHLHLEGANIMGSSVETDRILGEHVDRALTDFQRRRG